MVFMRSIQATRGRLPRNLVMALARDPTHGTMGHAIRNAVLILLAATALRVLVGLQGYSGMQS